MVMKRNAMAKNLTQSIRRSFGRYIAIVAIIALGAGLFLGLLMTKTDMVATGQAYMDRQNLYDLRAISNYGWTAAYVDKIAALDGVEQAEGVKYLDLIARWGDHREDAVYRFYSMPQTLNKLSLRAGRMPESPDECLADGFQGTEAMLGKQVVLSDSNSEDALDDLRYQTYTVVGLVATPLYMDMNRGTTSVGSGTLSNYFFIPEEAFDTEYYTEVYLTLPGENSIYTAAYEQAMEDASDALEPRLEQLAQERFQEVKDEAEEEYAEGLLEYEDGWKELNDGRHEAGDELHAAWDQLKDGEAQIARNRRKLIEGESELKSGKKELKSERHKLEDAEYQLNQQKPAALAKIAEEQAKLDSGMAALEPYYAEAAKVVAEYERLNGAKTELESREADVNSQISGLNSEIAGLQEKLNQAASDEEKEQIRGQIADLESQLSGLKDSLSTIQADLAACNAALGQLEGLIADAKDVVARYEKIQAGYALLDAEKAKLAAAEAQIAEGKEQIRSAEKKLEEAEKELQSGWWQLNKAQEEVDEGWLEYADGKAEARQEIDDGLVELRDAKQELADARQEIDDLEESKLYLLDRTSNPGYNNLESSSDIVAGVSRVMPVFFLLVASLVCITTMTRMIDEERIQIGTLKALGYGEGAIIGKYLAYSGTGAVLGCGLGVLVGSVVFPQILWNAYCIMLYIQPNVVLTIDWPLCLGVVALYTAVMLSVTWYSCHKTLSEQPAELIRPKAPNAGRKILLEYLPFWDKIPFLDKVSLRNIFRYRQRLAMMLVGIGGCTALLLTGFGLRDSIVNVVDYQFAEVTNYDISVYFQEGLTQMQRTDFLNQVEGDVEDAMFYHQSSTDLLFDSQVKSVYLIAGGRQLPDFIKFHAGNQQLSLPAQNQVLLSVGAAEALGIREGDTVRLRNADLEILELTVSGIYDNHVYNYAIVAPETIESQWGQLPEEQMAFLNVRDGVDIHQLGARVSDMDTVMNIAVSQDMADTVGSMMDALDGVVWIIVFCAGLLAVTVLYNLTNININERLREIATIKVLGFNAAETAAYVFKENMTLTVAGALFGLPLGMGLLVFVMSQIKIDLVWFKALVEPASFLYSIALTFLSAIAVNFIFYFKLQKINMAEALKSVE